VERATSSRIERFMGPALYLIAILGCGEGDTACREVQIAPPRYASEAACAAATAGVLERYIDLAYPSVVAQCRPAGASPTQLRGRDVLLPEPAPARPQSFADARSSR
jgi:hypothetical protein